MKKIFKCLVSIFLVSSMLFGNILFAKAEVLSHTVTKPEEREYVQLETADSYEVYLKKHKDAQDVYEEVSIDASKFSTITTDYSLKKNYEDKSGTSLLTGEEGYVEWKFNAPKSGFYQIFVEYYPIAGRSASIGRTVYVDGSLPFKEARNVYFDRIFVDVADENGNIIGKDSAGNDVRPEQMEKPSWQIKAVSDSIGYEQQPLRFYFSAGSHTLRFDSVREPMLISSIKLYCQKKLQSYAEVKKQYKENGYSATDTDIQKIQAETPFEKSDSTIIPQSDRSTSATEPNDPSILKLNTLGGSNWTQNGQWVSWKFNVPQNGLYNISLKAIQNVTNGGVSYRRVYLDNKVPFAELETVAFPYSTNWKMVTLGDENEAYSFYLTKGEHELKLQVVLGNMSDYIREISEAVEVLNKIYRKILVVTGPTPDTNQDYQFEKIMPDVIKEMDEQAKILEQVYKKISDSVGMSGENIQILIRSARQIHKMYNNPDTIAKQFTTFQGNIGSLASWVTSSMSQPLALDYFAVFPAGSKAPSAKASFLSEIKFHIYGFLSSFFQDYNVIASEGKNGNITVWVGSGLTGGRDQAQILRSMATNFFTSKTDIGVNVALVSMGALLPATLSGKGPDVVLSLGANEATNYAFRNAVENLSRYDGFDEVAARFNESALKPLTFNGGVYGIPETQTYPMMFYRKDILSELNVDVPKTWDDVIRILPVLQKKQMNFGLPSTSGVGSTMAAFSMLLYQSNGSLYNEDGSKSTIDSDEGLDVLSFLASLYNDYDLSKELDFINRFRTGEVPIGIADYSAYNQLSVFAPELDGIWDFTIVPGTKNDKGTINHSVPANVNACIMLKQSKNKKPAWEFIKWWTDTEAQVKFGRELESVMGTAARYPTANVEAIYQIPWSKSNFEKISQQGKWTVGIPEVPGGYYTPRYIDFAFRDVVNLGYDPGEAIATAVKSIQFELEAKRREFGIID